MVIKPLLLLIIFSVVSSAAPCVKGTFAEYEGLGASGCTLGGMMITDFAMNFGVINIPANIAQMSASNITVTPSFKIDGFGNTESVRLDFIFEDFRSNAYSNDVLMMFNLFIPVPYWTSSHVDVGVSFGEIIDSNLNAQLALVADCVGRCSNPSGYFNPISGGSYAHSGLLRQSQFERLFIGYQTSISNVFPPPELGDDSITYRSGFAEVKLVHATPEPNTHALAGIALGVLFLARASRSKIR
jgi:hypothetical protein